MIFFKIGDKSVNVRQNKCTHLTVLVCISIFIEQGSCSQFAAISDHHIAKGARDGPVPLRVNTGAPGLQVWACRTPSFSGRQSARVTI